ncbi:ATP synthase F1 subunit epsilon [uncultured Agathobaculum sp.]|uniref:ATP synthase F1 subunit epsilon n=1 Tax=uncultured Agathobaculum sp. TaxID=2048140 RepID=UPI00296F185B
MAAFHLKVLTVDKEFFNGDVDRIVVRTTQGDVGILPNHVPYVAALGIGSLTIVQNGERRVAAVSGGFVDVSADQTVVLARTCEWADEIDVARAREAAERAKAVLQRKESDREMDIAQVKLKKATNRIRISGK